MDVLFITIISVSLYCPNVVPPNMLSMFSLGLHLVIMLCGVNDINVM